MIVLTQQTVLCKCLQVFLHVYEYCSRCIFGFLNSKSVDNSNGHIAFCVL